jgi:hypothetical protein
VGLLLCLYFVYCLLHLVHNALQPTVTTVHDSTGSTSTVLYRTIFFHIAVALLVLRVLCHTPSTQCTAARHHHSTQQYR